MLDALDPFPALMHDDGRPHVLFSMHQHRGDEGPTGIDRACRVAGERQTYTFHKLWVPNGITGHQLQSMRRLADLSSVARRQVQAEQHQCCAQTIGIHPTERRRRR